MRFSKTANSIKHLALLILLICLAVPGISHAQLGADGEDEVEESEPSGTEVKVGLSLGGTRGVEVQGSERTRHLFKDFQGYSVGADVRISPKESQFIFNPTFEFYGGLNESVEIWSISANALYNFAPSFYSFKPYAGVGFAFYRESTDDLEAGRTFFEGGIENKLGVNTIIGIEFTEGALQPFVEARYSPVLRSEPGIFAGKPGHLLGVEGGLVIRL